jgi:hypothetical protein
MVNTSIAQPAEMTESDWRSSLRAQLEDAVPRDRASGLDRVRWLAVRLIEYIDRWIGFVEHPAVVAEPRSFAFESGLFSVIGIAIEQVSAEAAVTELPSAAASALNDLVTSHETIRAKQDVMARHLLHRRSCEFLDALASSS